MNELSAMENRLTSIEQRLVKIETVLERLDHYLLGNGQPGQISVLDRRLNAVEAFVNRVAGVGLFVGLALAVGQFILSLKGK